MHQAYLISKALANDGEWKVEFPPVRFTVRAPIYVN